MCDSCSLSILRGRLLLLLALLSIGAVVALLGGCNHMLNGGPPPTKTDHFTLTIVNQDVASDETATLCWWNGTGVVGTRDLLVPAGGEATISLGTVKPDGIQVIMTAWPGIQGGPGGNVLQQPSDYPDPCMHPVLYYTSGFVTR
jgi:hypothetical protein